MINFFYKQTDKILLATIVIMLPVGILFPYYHPYLNDPVDTLVAGMDSFDSANVPNSYPKNTPNDADRIDKPVHRTSKLGTIIFFLFVCVIIFVICVVSPSATLSLFPKK